MRSLRHRLTAWLALVALLWMGVVPSQGLVLCLEPDGTIALECADVKLACEACDQPASEDGAQDRMVSPASECCACLDIPVSGSSKTRVAPVSAKPSIDLAPAPAVELSVERLAPPLARVRSPHDGPLGPPGARAHRRTVVLRV